MVLSSVMQDRVILGEIKLFKVKSFIYTVCLGIFVDFLDIYESISIISHYDFGALNCFNLLHS